MMATGNKHLHGFTGCMQFLSQKIYEAGGGTNEKEFRHKLGCLWERIDMTAKIQRSKASSVRLRRTGTKGKQLDDISLRPWVSWSKHPPLSVTHPKLVPQWHPSKNGPWTPDDFTFGSHVAIWWKCPKGPDHVWKTAIKSRAAGNNCPFCRSYYVSATNSLAWVYPELAKLWHPTKNGDLSPSDIPARSNHRIWWQCPNGLDHEWQASPNTKIANSTGCPFCNTGKLSITNSLASLFPNIASQWHPTKNKHLTPSDFAAGSNSKAWWKCPKGPDHVWQAVIGDCTRGKGGCPFCRGRRVSKGRSLKAVNPQLAAEWHPTLNKPLKPDQVMPNSNKYAFWQCKRAKHVWKAAVCDRNRGRNCPECRRASRNKSTNADPK